MSDPYIDNASLLHLPNRQETSEEVSLKIMHHYERNKIDLLTGFRLYARVFSDKEWWRVSSLKWTYTLKSESWSPQPRPAFASFGQAVLREKPSFYLFTRFLVIDSTTGAPHVFRIQHEKDAQLYPDLRLPAVLMM
jgi:hypothetical protein